jgi:glutathione S-transferase
VFSGAGGWLQRACGSILTKKRVRMMRARRQLDSDRSRSPSGRFHLFPDQNGATFATVLRAFERGCRNRENVPVEFEEPDLVGSGPSLIRGTLLAEGTAIVQYIGDLVPAKKLVPSNGTIETVKLQAWLNFCASEMHKDGFSPLFYKGIPEEGRDVFRTRLRSRFSHLDAHLSSNKYLMGTEYSVADTHLFVVSNWANWVNFDLSPYRAVLSFRERVHARPAVIAALKTEGLYPWPASQPH